MNEWEIEQIVKRVLKKYSSSQRDCKTVPIEASARHVHLNSEAVEQLFGKGAVLTKKRELSQPGEFLCEQRIKLVTPKGELANVAVLGPARSAVQVELSLTDTRLLGLNAPVNLSGDLQHAADVYLVGPCGVVDAKQSVIVAKNHIHMTPTDAESFGLTDGDLVRVLVQTKRPITFEQVAVRVKETFALAMHIDFDEANACGLENTTAGTIV